MYTMRYLTTVTAIRHHPTMRAYCMRLCRRGKLRKGVLTAPRKLFLLNAVIRDQVSWYPILCAGHQPCLILSTQ